MTDPLQIVYVVDDIADVRESIAHTLEGEGYAVVSFASPGEYLRFDVAREPHCLIVDLLLPGMSGLKLLRQVVTRATPCAFLMISASGDVRSAVEAMHLGAVDFLEKPFSSTLLVDAVRRALAVARARFSTDLDKHDRRPPA